MTAHKYSELFLAAGSASIGQQRSGIFSWVLRDYLGALHPLTKARR